MPQDDENKIKKSNLKIHIHKGEIEMNKDVINLRNTFDSIIDEYDKGSMLKDDDSIKSWIARCDWLVKQMGDIKIGAGFKYFELQKEYNPLQENNSVGEGEETE